MGSEMTTGGGFGPREFPGPVHERVHARLKRIVGGGAPSYFADTCKIALLEPPLKARTHFIGHGMREVESALRDVLVQLVAPSIRDELKSGKSRDGHERSIRAILEALGL